MNNKKKGLTDIDSYYDVKVAVEAGISLEELLEKNKHITPPVLEDAYAHATKEKILKSPLGKLLYKELD